jgi:hypothetical protein
MFGDCFPLITNKNDQKKITFPAEVDYQLLSILKVIVYWINDDPRVVDCQAK